MKRSSLWNETVKFPTSRFATRSSARNTSSFIVRSGCRRSRLNLVKCRRLSSTSTCAITTSRPPSLAEQCTHLSCPSTIERSPTVRSHTVGRQSVPLPECWSRLLCPSVPPLGVLFECDTLVAGRTLKNAGRGASPLCGWLAFSQCWCRRRHQRPHSAPSFAPLATGAATLNPRIASPPSARRPLYRHEERVRSHAHIRPATSLSPPPQSNSRQRLYLSGPRLLWRASSHSVARPRAAGRGRPLSAVAPIADGHLRFTMRGECRRTLSVEVVGARGVARREAEDAYCELQLGASLALRSPSVAASARPVWRFAAEFATPAEPERVRLRVQIRSEKVFFFDMFPKTPNGLPNGLPAAAAEANEPMLDVAFVTSDCHAMKAEATAGSDSDGGRTHSEDEDEFDESPSPLGSLPPDEEEDAEDAKVYKPVESKVEFAAASPGEEEPIGTVEINAGLLCDPARTVTDAWYPLMGENSAGQVRIRTIWLEDNRVSLSDTEREAIFEQHISRMPIMRDHYGFAVPEAARRQWFHLRSYEECRERQRVEQWVAEFGDHFPDIVARDERLEPRSRRYKRVVRLARDGIPRSWRQQVYMSVSGMLLLLVVYG